MLLVVTYSASAWDGIIVGKIASIDVTAGNNYGFRVSLEGSPAICGNAHTWAFLNETDSNYQTFVSVLLTAKVSKQNITLYTNRAGADSAGYCHIGYIQIH